MGRQTVGILAPTTRYRRVNAGARPSAHPCAPMYVRHDLTHAPPEQLLRLLGGEEREVDQRALIHQSRPCQRGAREPHVAAQSR